MLSTLSILLWWELWYPRLLVFFLGSKTHALSATNHNMIMTFFVGSVHCYSAKECSCIDPSVFWENLKPGVRHHLVILHSTMKHLSQKAIYSLCSDLFLFFCQYKANLRGSSVQFHIWYSVLLPSIYGISKTIASEAFIWQYISIPYHLSSSGDWLSFVALIFTFKWWARHSSAWYLFSLRILQCVNHYEQWRYLHVNKIICKLYALLLKDIN